MVKNTKNGKNIATISLMLSTPSQKHIFLLHSLYSAIAASYLCLLIGIHKNVWPEEIYGKSSGCF
jgi:hypothetical protein